MYNVKILAKIAIIASIFSLPFMMTQTASASDISVWQKKIGKLVAKKQVYPRAAMRKELEGRARVKISIDRSGEIKNFEIMEKTGHAILDKEVPKLMARLNPLPTPPASLSDSQLSFILPLSWRLQ